MDHTLRSISFIADIGDVLVVMVRRGTVVASDSPLTRHKVCCHVFLADDVRSRSRGHRLITWSLSLSLGSFFNTYQNLTGRVWYW